jgi:AraC family transcriptional regulator of adaptative response/methylated-DNA-[protein]-cysteine methyltransferase
MAKQLTANQPMLIDYCYMHSPVGELLVAATAKGFCYIGFCAAKPRVAGIGHALQDLQHRFLHATIRANQMMDVSALSQWFASPQALLPLDLLGSDFDRCVWSALQRMPFAQLTTYSEVARCINKPKAVRAVASAIGRNPLCIVIPCHRVLPKAAKQGVVGGYYWGQALKAKLIDWEIRHATGQ